MELSLIRIALINPCNRPEEVNEPLGIQVLSAALRARFGDDVDVRLDFVQTEAEQQALLEQLHTWEPDLIGISSKIGELAPLLAYYRFAENSTHRPTFVVGDQLATLAPDALLGVAPRAICVIGEGEEALNGIVEAIISLGCGVAHEHLCRALVARDVPNCAFIHDDAPRRTSSHRVAQVGILPPDRPFLDRAVSEGWVIHAEASRGCPWGRCTFCYVGQKYHGISEQWRPAPIANILADLEILSERGARTVFFTDEDFVGPDWERIFELCNALADAKTSGRISEDMRYFVSAGVRTLLDHDREHAAEGGVPKLMRALERAGVRELFLGIDSGCSSQLKCYKKGASKAQNLKAIGWVRAAGIDLDLGFLPFDPWTTLDDLAESLEFARAAGLVQHHVRIMKKVLLTPGTPIAARFAQQHPSAPLDLSDLTLRYEFQDARVGRIWQLIERRWQARKSAIYRAQAARRVALAANASLRSEFTAVLERERADDFEFVWRCVAAAREVGDNWPSALESVRAFDRILGKERSMSASGADRIAGNPNRPSAANI
jgi:radical SAM superfamily enzyme YgiQ (UPF0313 family)